MRNIAETNLGLFILFVTNILLDYAGEQKSHLFSNSGIIAAHPFVIEIEIIHYVIVLFRDYLWLCL